MRICKMTDFYNNSQEIINQGLDIQAESVFHRKYIELNKKERKELEDLMNGIVKYEVQSKSDPKLKHVVKTVEDLETHEIDYSCDCKVYQYNNKCWHIEKIMYKTEK